MPAALVQMLNVLALYAISSLLIVAFSMQLALNELPCPLCMMQRALFCAMGAGFILNLVHGTRASHYALSILAALLGTLIADRHILLHILPGDPGYGTAVAGMHYYTWAAVVYLFAIFVLTLLLIFDRNFGSRPAKLGLMASTAIWLAVLLTALNVLSTVLMCGFGACPDDPTRYLLIDKLLKLRP